MNNFNILSCPHNNFFACSFQKYQSCDSCEKKDKCKEIKEKYNITDLYEQISFSKARDFINEIWGKTWAYPIDVKRNAKKYGLAIEIKNNNYVTWKITYKQIFELMETPLWKTMYYGRVHVK